MEKKIEHSEILFKNNLLAIGKLNYAKGERPNVDCIFCAVRDDHPDVTSLKIYQDSQLMVCLNLYPYNTGHLMVIPSRHVEKFEDLHDNERDHLFKIVIQLQKLLSDVFSPTGFNVGYNQGSYSGASIPHIHVHIVPRYKSELGYIDIISQTKILIQPVEEVMEKLKQKMNLYLV